MSCSGIRQNSGVAVALPLMLCATGCGPALYPVGGKVTLANGTPLTAGMVVFESKDAQPPVTARGEIQPDGSYQLSTHRLGDGVPAGKYRALVAPRTDPNAVDGKAPPPPFDPRFTEFGTSGLEFEVTTAGPNDFPIKLGAKR
jgi:hypothetical protein